MILKHISSLFLVFLFFNGISYAQQNKYVTTVKFHNGFILPHHRSISYMRKSDIEAVEINFGLISNSKKRWAKLYNQPEIGLAFYHSNLGNDEVWGNVSSLFPYINFHLFNSGRLHIINHLGLGLAYNDKIYHPTENFKNILISSKINAFFSLSLEAELSIHPRWQLIAGMGLKHISNGASKNPNKGINLLVGNVGIKYALSDRPHIIYQKKEKYKKLDNEYSIAWNHGRKQAKENDEHRYYISNICTNYAIGINAKQRIGFGIDLFYDESVNRGTWDLDPQTSFKDQFSQGVHISHDLVISDFTFILQIGAYTFYKTEPKLPIYTRLGLRYNLGKRFFTNFNLKAHAGKADNIEWGLGFRFKNRR